MYIYVYTYLYIYIYIHTHSHRHLHTQTISIVNIPHQFLLNSLLLFFARFPQVLLQLSSNFLWTCRTIILQTRKGGFRFEPWLQFQFKFGVVTRSRLSAISGLCCKAKDPCKNRALLHQRPTTLGEHTNRCHLASKRKWTYT